MFYNNKWEQTILTDYASSPAFRITAASARPITRSPVTSPEVLPGAGTTKQDVGATSWPHGEVWRSRSPKPRSAQNRKLAADCSHGLNIRDTLNAGKPQYVNVQSSRKISTKSGTQRPCENITLPCSVFVVASWIAVKNDACPFFLAVRRTPRSRFVHDSWLGVINNVWHKF